MINEWLFLAHVMALLLTTWLALRLGREGLVAWICVQGVLCNLFVMKQIQLFGLTVTACDAYAVSMVFGLNLLQEYYGKSIAKTTVWISAMVLGFFILMSEVHLAYVPSAFDIMQSPYVSLLSRVPRILVASLVVSLISQKFDVVFFAFLKQRFPASSLAVRTTVSLLLSQLIDTFGFTVLGMGGIATSLFSVFVVGYLVKVVAITLVAPFAMLTRRIITVKACP